MRAATASIVAIATDIPNSCCPSSLDNSAVRRNLEPYSTIGPTERIEPRVIQVPKLATWLSNQAPVAPRSAVTRAPAPQPHHELFAEHARHLADRYIHHGNVQ